MIKHGSSLLPSVAVGITVVVWATAFPAIKLALTEIEALPLASIRYAIAAALAVVWLMWKRPARMTVTGLAVCVGCGVIGGAGYSVLLNFGQQTVSAGAASFLIKTESLWMALLAVLFLKERFNSWARGGTALSIVGVGMIASAQPGGMSLGTGAALVLGAAMCSATGFTLQRRLVARYGAIHVAATMFIAAALALSPWLPLAVEQTGDASVTTLAWVAFLGIFPTTVGLVCWAYALGHFGVARAGNFLYLVAPLATLIAWIVAAEMPLATTVVGGMLILSGVILVNTRGRSKQLFRTDTGEQSLIADGSSAPPSLEAPRTSAGLRPTRDSRR